MQIQKNKVVHLSYELRVDSGEVVDAATQERPFAFIHGTGYTLEAFDRQLEGKSTGEDFNFSLSSEEAYGAYEKDYIANIPKDIFEDAPEGTLVVGKTLPMQDEQGNPLMGTILDIQDGVVVMDFNHPLAGEALHFTGKVLEIREATASELEHGHVHGEHGHQH